MSVNTQLKYLNIYAEDEVSLLGDFPDINYQHVLVVPAYKELPDFLEQYKNRVPSQKLLIILIVNQPQSDLLQSPQELLCNTIDSNQPLWQANHLSLHHQNRNTDILLGKRFTDGLRIADKFGVGLARKIGADIAVYLILNRKISSPWIAFTDADATLPNNYFETIASQNTEIDALTFDYRHQGEDHDIQTATKLYETGLKYFQAGLAWAGSRYAFHAVGSCLAVNSHAYAIHRGMPKRPAGEDFYLLNKIAKRGMIKHLDNCQIVLESRTSKRTPFGTGSAVNKILANEKHHYYYYHPDCFTHLKRLLESLSILPAQQQYYVWRECLMEENRPILKKLGLEKYHAHHLKQNFNERQLHDDIHSWFDGLKTLQFINYIRDYHKANIPLQQAIENSTFKI